MKIPKKISPDRIKDAIVEIKYTSNLPFEVIVGYFFKALDETYQYTNRPTQTIATPIDIEQNGIRLELGSQNLFFNDKIRIQLKPNSIIFHCLNSYLSWFIYLPEIEKVIKQLVEAKAIESFNRIGIRYISEYPNIELQSCIKFSFSFGMPEIISKTYSFKSEFQYKGNRVILNLHNKLPVLKQRPSKIEIDLQQISQIDIDVIRSDFSVNADEYQSLSTLINDVHNSEKEIFFNLLNSEFLETLNPEY